MSEPKPFGVTLQRMATGRYVATNARGVQLELGSDDDVFSPVEVLLAAIGACSAIDVDVVTSRRAEPERFEVTIGAMKVTDETGGNRLADVDVAFDVAFDDSPEGRQAAGLVPRLVRLSHDRDCTVSRTVALPTNLRMRVVDDAPTA